MYNLGVFKSSMDGFIKVSVLHRIDHIIARERSKQANNVFEKINKNSFIYFDVYIFLFHLFKKGKV